MFNSGLDINFDSFTDDDNLLDLDSIDDEFNMVDNKYKDEDKNQIKGKLDLFIESMHS